VVSDLEELGEDMGAVGTGGNAASGNKRDHFEALVDKIKREINTIFDKGIKKASDLPKQNNYGRVTSPEAQWRTEMHKMTELLNELLSKEYEDTNSKFHLIT
jgi:hypothetical protein